MGGDILMINEHEKRLGMVDHTTGVQARHEPDTLGTILAIARTEGCAPVTKITMRSVMWRLIERESNNTLAIDDVEEIEGIPVKIDDMIPFFPGFQIHREVW